MEKIQLNWLLKCKKPKLINSGEITEIYRLSDGKIFKYFNRQMLNLLKTLSFDFEQKILDSENITINEAVIKPEMAVYDGITFVGYIMQAAKGINYNDWDQKLTLSQRGDLYQYANVYSNLEGVVASTPNIVYPDLCTCDNIYIYRDKIQLIDYDGLQVGNHPTPAVSTVLCDSLFEKYLVTRKYYDGNLYTKELDQASLIILYFLTTFNVDLTKVGLVNPQSGDKITLDDMFQIIGLKDYDVMNKVWKIFQDKKENEYLGEDVFRIAEDYKLGVFPNQAAPGVYLKKLIRK